MADKFLISNFQTGLDQNREPWLRPQDAFIELFNGLVYKGALRPRKGIQQYATGTGGTPEESRLQGNTVETLTNAATLPDVDITVSASAIGAGAIYIVDASGAFVVEIDRSDTFSGDFTGATSINRGTGQITFTWDGAATDDPQISYPTGNSELPVVGIHNLINADGTRTLLCNNTASSSVYISSTNTFESVPFVGTSGGVSSYTGTNQNFFSSCNYPDASNNPRLVMVNNVDQPVFFDGTKILTYSNATDNTNYVAPSQGSLDTALHCFFFGGRILFLRPTLGGTIYRNAILYSAIQDSSGNGEKFTAPGSGLITLSDDGIIRAAIQLRDKLIIWTDENIWELSVTREFELPFIARRIATGEYRGSQASFSGATWLDSAAAVGKWGIVATDTRQADRIDTKLPFFTRQDILQRRFESIFGKSVPETSQWWWLYPAREDDDGTETFPSSRVLAFSYEEQNWAIYKLQLNVIGQFRRTSSIAWDDVNEGIKEEWAQWDTTTETWDSFFDQEDAQISLGGDNEGFIYQLEIGNDDFVTPITGISQAAAAVVTVQEGDKFQNFDLIRIDDVTGMQEDGESIVNNKIFRVTSVTGNQLTINLDSTGATAYSADGYVTKVIQSGDLDEGFYAETKPLNPYVDQDMKCHLQKVYFYVSTGTENFFVDFYADRRTEPYMSGVEIDCSRPASGDLKRWIPVTINQTADFHRIRIRQGNVPNCQIHGILWVANPVGRLF